MTLNQDSPYNNDFKEEIKNMVKEIKTIILTQVKVYFKEEISDVMKEMKLQKNIN